MTPTSSGQLLRLPPSPSSGRRRELPRSVKTSLLSGCPVHLRQAGCGPEPGHLRPKPSMTRVPCRLRRTGCDLDPDPRPASRPLLRFPTPPRITVGDSRPVSPPASRLELGPRSDTGRAGGLPWGSRELEKRTACRTRIGIQVAAGSPEATWDPGTLKASAGDGPDPDHGRLAGGGTETRKATKSPHCGATRSVGPMTGAAGDGGADR